MTQPQVSFIVPCFRLAHLLGQCVESILAQTYENFEILIMDDCSPDNTEEVARSFEDTRVRYIKNSYNIGHLRNYNLGITQSRGKYVWLISADDYLRRPYVLKRYVDVMETEPRVGYIVCPGRGVRNGTEGAVMGVYGAADQVIHGHVWLKALLDYNFVLAASAMVRRECYENVSLFPLNATWAGKRVEMGWAGDWYLWCLFALYYDVAYLAEPMVCYRDHELSLSYSLTQQENLDRCVAADIGVLWLIRQRALDMRLNRVAKDCLRAVAREYARHATSKKYRSGTSSFDLTQFEHSVRASTKCEKERRWIRSRFLVAMGDKAFADGDSRSARALYVAALRNDVWMSRAYLKLLLAFGRTGGLIRNRLFVFRRYLLAATSALNEPK